jgi:NitT/TauT family transport system ATP-binding protein
MSLVLENLSFAWDDSPILEDISLEIPAGQFVSLLGSSGSGKTTLLRLIAGLQLPQRGTIRWDGRRITDPSTERGVVFQDYALFPWLNLTDNVALAVAKAEPLLARTVRREKAVHFLHRVGLEAAVNKYPFEVSGGMQQRGAIARALALGSPLLLMDEPFGALDPVTRARLQDLLLEIWEGDGRVENERKTIVFVTHDVDEALYLSDRVAILGAAPGRLIADLAVDFPRHRERRSLLSSTGFHALRERVAEELAADTLRRLVAA